MSAIHDNPNYQKFFALEEEKRERIISAAMKEFLHGFKHASTDNIVREAGISKGLLFHYFGTKENLYIFLIEYVADTLKEEFVSVLNLRQPDILDSLWQASLLKYDLSMKYPVIFDFITAAYMDAKNQDTFIKETIEDFVTIRNKAMADIYSCADYTLFREDVDPQMVINTITWAMNGYAEVKSAQTKALTANQSEAPGESVRDNYETYLEEFKGYLDLFRRCFYK